MGHAVRITEANWEAAPSYDWPRPMFTPDTGIGSLPALHTVGNAVVAVAGLTDDVTHFVGSGVMVAPGLLLTATHVLREFPDDGPGPMFLTFLPEGARAWRPYQTNTLRGSDDGVLVGLRERHVVSDLTLVSCVLSSDALDEHPLNMAALEVDLPIPGERLWAVGFRQGDVDDDGTGVTPLVASGLVTECFPHGRDRNLRGPCVEVAMETFGGMSGGPVFNERGYVVGLVSSSFESTDDLGPTYVTFIWDAFRVAVTAPWPKDLWIDGEADLFTARELNVAVYPDNLKRDADWNITMTLRNEAVRVMADRTPVDQITRPTPE